MKAYGIICLSFGIAICIIGALNYWVIDNAIEKGLRVAIAQPSLTGEDRIENSMWRTELARLKSGDIWWFVAGGVVMIVGGYFWAKSHELALSREAQVNHKI